MATIHLTEPELQRALRIAEAANAQWLVKVLERETAQRRGIGNPIHPLLIILNPRRIPECIRSLERLTTPKAWITGYTERQLADVINPLIQRLDYYTHFIVISDDCIVDQQAIDTVIQALADGHPVATGWCHLDSTDPRINLTRTPLVGDQPHPNAYDFYTAEELDEHEHDPAPTHFAGFALTGMTRELWLQFPFGAYGLPNEPGNASDFHLCTRLRDAGIPIVAPKNAWVHHVKERWCSGDRDPRKALLIGQIEPSVTLEP